MKRPATTAAAVLSVLVVAACGGTSTPGAAPAATPSMPAATPAAAGDHNAADVMFAQMMIPHHEQAIQMAELAPQRSGSAQVRALAAQIKGAQDPEINQMKTWLATWGQPGTAGGMTGMNEGPMSGSGMMSRADMSKLASMSGAAFDREFLTMMTAHHQGAIDMARTEQADGRYGPATTMAGTIVHTQTDEIGAMNDLLRSMP